MTRNEESLQTLFSNTGIKSEFIREQEPFRSFYTTLVNTRDFQYSYGSGDYVTVKYLPGISNNDGHCFAIVYITIEFDKETNSIKCAGYTQILEGTPEQQVRQFISNNPQIQETIKKLNDKGIRITNSRRPIKSTHLLKSGRRVSVTGEPYSEDYVNGWGYGHNENGIKDKVLEEWDDYYRSCARSGAEAYEKGLTLNDNPYLDEKSFGTTKFAEYWELGWKGEKEREQEERDYQKYLWEREEELKNYDRYDDRYYD